jgi:hypothetical protein
VDISAFKTRGIYIDPSFKLDQITLKRVTRMVLVLPLVNGATALLELLPRPLLLFPRAPSIPRALVCAAPPHGHVVRRFRATMRTWTTRARRRKSLLPPEANVLIVGHSTVGKTALGDTLHRLARKVGSPVSRPYLARISPERWARHRRHARAHRRRAARLMLAPLPPSGPPPAIPGRSPAAPLPLPAAELRHSYRASQASGRDEEGLRRPPLNSRVKTGRDGRAVAADCSPRGSSGCTPTRRRAVPST